MKKRTSNLSRRIVSLLMSMVLTLTLVTPAAFAMEVVDDSGTTIVEDNTNPADANPNEDTEGKDDVDKNAEDVQQPAEPDDEDKEPSEGEGEDDANKPDEDKKDEAPDEENKDEQHTEESSEKIDTLEGEGTTPAAVKRTVTLEKWNENNITYDVKIVIPAAASEPGEGEDADTGSATGNETLSNEYTGIDGKITLKLTTEGYDEAIYIKSSADEVVTETTHKLGDDGTLEYAFTGEDTDVTLYYGTRDDFVSGWYGDGSAKEYTIRSAEELAYLAQLVNGGNDFSGKTVTLVRDIDLSAVCGEQIGNWTPIGNQSNKFNGEFNGAGHTISGLYISLADGMYQGLFGIVDKTAKIRNLIVEGNVTITAKKANNGGIVGKAATGTVVQNCGFYGKVITAASSGVGGVVGAGNSVAKNCWYYQIELLTGETTSVKGVCGGIKPSNCYQNAYSGNNAKGTYSETLNTPEVVEGLNADDNGVATGMIWAMDTSDGAAYPKLVIPSKAVTTVTINPIFPDLDVTLTVTENGTALPEEDGVYNVTANAVAITITTNDNKQIFFATSESAAENERLSSGTEFDVKAPTILYYGTAEDFDTMAAWNSVKHNSITTEGQLKALARIVNRGKDSMDGKTIFLQKDITLTDNWTPIGTATNPFKGSFNGAYYTISGLKVDGTYLDAGLFGVVEMDSKKIQLLTVTGSVKSDSESANIGGIVGHMVSGTVENCLSLVDVASSDNNAIIGGVVGQNDGTVQICASGTSKDVPAVGSGTTTNCFYLAGKSTFGTENSANGARTAEEFAAGRVTWELSGGKNSLAANVYWSVKDGMPLLMFISNGGIDGRVYELTLTKVYAPDEKDIVLAGGDGVTVLHNGDTWYAYCTGEKWNERTVSVTTADISSNNAVTYGINGEPTKIANISNSGVTNKTENTYYYTISKKAPCDIQWYLDDPDKDIYELNSTAQLFGFAALVNGTAKRIDGTSVSPVTFKDKTVKLTNTIDLSGYVWMPIGNRAACHFDGTFNGNSHSITNMDVNTAGYSYAGLFGNVNGGTVQNVRVEGSITAQNASYVGGIVGYTNGTVENCLSKVTIIANGSVTGVGGIVGYCSSNHSVNLCWNEGSVTGNGTVGGIVGMATATSMVTNCANFGAVTGNNVNNNAGGIAGIGTVVNSYNLGSVTGTEGKVYGICGNTAANSYYICELNSERKMVYVNTTETPETPITLADDGKTYMADDAKLVDVLNGSRGNYELWFINFEKNVFLPRHATKWDGETDTDCTFKTITVTYDPNDGVNKDGNNTPVTVSEMVYVVGEDVAAPAQHIVLSVDAEALGFKHENGTFDSWKDNNGASHIAGDILTGITENITLTAQWHNIWVGTGTEADPYQIPSIDELTKLQEQVNGKGFDYKDKWFKLTGSIDMSNVNWVPIAGFSGNLNGNHCTISGLTVNVDVGYAGLFTGVSGTFQDLTLDNPVVTGTNYCGSLSGYGNGATLINITAKNVAVSSTGGSAGGLVGRDNAISAKNCRVEGGNVTGRDRAAGIGTAVRDNSPTILNCHNSADIRTTATSVKSGIAAGIWACDTYGASGSTFTGCTNSGTVSGGSYTAGIATAASTIENCVNRGNITSSGGLAGGISNNARWISYCGNTGTIIGRGSTTSRESIAGINSGIDGNVEFCYNTGVIADSTGNSNRIYGIAAGLTGNCRLKNCFSYVKGNSGKVVDIPLISNVDTDGKVTNSYYLASGATAVSSAGTWASADDFASGKVAWGVDGGTGKHENYWTQGANNYPVPIGEGTSTSYYRAKAECGTGGAVSIKSSRNFAGDADNAVYGPKGTSVTVTATPKDDTFGLKSLTLDLMGTGSTTALESGDSFTLGEANALVVATFASTGNGGSGDGTGGNGGDGDGTGTDTGDGAGDENDEGLQDGLNMDVEYDVKGLVLAAYGAWGAEGSGKTFTQWLKDSPEVLRALITNSLDNMAVAAMGKKTDEAKDLAALLLASLNEHSGLDSQSSDTIAKMLRKYIESGTEAAFSAWLTTGGGMASGTYESIFAQYTNRLLALADRLYTNWESSGTSLTFPQWLDAQQVTMESLSENAEEPDAEPDDTQTTEAPEDVPDGQEAEGGASSGNSVWEVIGTVVRENPIIVWSIVAVVAALIIVGAVRRYHKVKRDERDDVSSKK